MTRRTFWSGMVWPLAIALLLALSLVPMGSSPAVTLSIADYFSYSYTVQFSKSDIAGGEVFNATVEANATCTNSVPLAPNEASFTSRIVAIHQASGDRVTLNSNYTLTLSPFPSHTGDSTQVSQVVPLQFPAGSQSGAYSVAGELIEAKVKVGIIWIPVTGYLPSSQALGSVTYISGAAGGGIPAAPPPVTVLPSAPTSPITGAGQASWTPTGSGLTPAAITVTSPDNKSTVTVTQGTLARDNQGNPLATITCNPPAAPAPTPPDKNIIAVYDLGPPGATFGSPITITMKYDPASLPAGAVEGSLTLAFYNATTGAWITLNNIVVDTTNHTVSGMTDHFTQFAVLSSRVPTLAPVPAATPTPTPANAPAPAPAPAAAPVPAPAPTTPQATIFGLIAAAAVAGLIACFMVLRRRRTTARH
ncbi:MAG: hypothetical protein Q8P00_04230 [Dehalococcoidia bacterium]|nr:hypothetical protein [Dehalococcoidia bacterium]